MPTTEAYMPRIGVQALLHIPAGIGHTARPMQPLVAPLPSLPTMMACGAACLSDINTASTTGSSSCGWSCTS